MNQKIDYSLIEDYPTEDEMEDTLTEAFGTVKVGTFEWDAGRVVRLMDPVAFRCLIAESLRFRCPECGALFDAAQDAWECCE